MYYDNYRQVSVYIAAFIAILILKRIINGVFTSIFEKRLSLERFPGNSQARHLKIEKLNEHVMKITVYVIINSFLYWVIKDAKFLHWTFGGKYERLVLFDNYPCMDVPQYLNEYYCIAIAYYT